jgi:hypothetical protein
MGESKSMADKLAALPLKGNVPEGYGYLMGFKGVLVIYCFLWTFLSLYLPPAVKNSDDHDGPAYALGLRKSLSVLFWNDTLITNAFVLLSGRTLALPFFHNPNHTVAGSAILRRGVRFWIPTAAAILIPYVLSRTTHTYEDVVVFREQTGYKNPSAPYIPPTGLAVFNSIFEMFWVNHWIATQAGARAFPSGTLYMISLIYQQSFTVFICMIAEPYTRPNWRWKFGFLFIATAWWVDSWAWHTISGLLLADAVKNMALREKLVAGFSGTFRIPRTKRLRNWHIPGWVVPALALLAGLMMQFVWAAAVPSEANGEIEAHSGIYNHGDLNAGWKRKEPQQRVDDWLVILGTLMLLERFATLRFVLDNPVLKFLGTRSLSMLYPSSHHRHAIN